MVTPSTPSSGYLVWKNIDGKRKDAPKQEEKEPELKRVKKEQKILLDDNEPFYGLPNELVCHIISFFALKEILNFELTFRAAQNYTSNFWKREIGIRHLAFPFSLCESTFSEKERLIFVASIVSYIFDVGVKTSSDFDFEKVAALKKKYSYPMARFPKIRQIILEDLFKFSNPMQYCDFEDRVLNSTIYEKALEGTAGEIFVLAIKSKRRGMISPPYFKTAVEHGATVAGLFFVTFVNHPDKKFGLEMATLCADQGDNRALDKVLIENPGFAEEKGLKDKSYPSTLLGEMYETLKADDADHVIHLSRKAIRAYGRNVPGELYKWLAKAYYRTGEFRKAISFYQKAITAFGSKVPHRLVLRAAKLNYRENYFIADRICRLFPYERKGNSITAPFMNQKLFHKSLKISGRIKIALKDYKEALIFFKNAPDAKSKLEEIAFIKKKWGKFSKAEKIYERIKKEFTISENIPHNCYTIREKKFFCDLADVKFRLGKFEESAKYYQLAFPFEDHYAKKADECFTQQLAAGENQPNFLKMAAKNKESLKQYEAADQLYDQIRQTLQDKIPPETLERACTVKLKLKKDREAEEIMNQLLSSYNESYCCETLILKMAKKKLKLKDWVVADKLFGLLPKEEYKSEDEEDLPVRAHYLDWAFVKTKLERWDEAYALYNNHFTMLYDESKVKHHIYSYAEAALQTKGIQEALYLFEWAVRSSSPRTPLDPELLKKADNFFTDLVQNELSNLNNLTHLAKIKFLSHLAKIKFLLRDFETANEIYEQLLASPEANPLLIFYASQVKIALKELTKAEELLDQALKLSGEKEISGNYYEIWAQGAAFKRKIGKVEEANRLYDRLFKDFGKKMKLSHLKEFLSLKTSLGMWHQADQICQKILHKPQEEKWSFELFISLATVKTKLEKPEANHFMKKALKKLDENNVSHLNALALSKKYLKQFDEADQIYQKISKLEGSQEKT